AVAACIGAGLVSGEGFAVDASLIQADANKHRSIPGTEWNKNIDPDHARRAVKEYLATLDDPACGTASDVTPKFVSPSDPAAQWTGAAVKFVLVFFAVEVGGAQRSAGQFFIGQQVAPDGHSDDFRHGVRTRGAAWSAYGHADDAADVVAVDR